MPRSSKKPFPGVIIFHGMTSSAASYIPFATLLAKQGIAGLAISMRGHGKSEGDFNKATVAEALNDAVAAYDFLTCRADIDVKNIGMVGSSAGAILAAMATQKRAVKSLIFRAPAAYTSEMMHLSMAGTMVNEGRQFHEIKDLSSTPAGLAIKEFSGSLLIIASENDATIPASVTSGYIKIAKQANKKQMAVI